MASSSASPVPVPSAETIPDDSVLARSSLSFSSSSVGSREGPEFWSRARKEMIQPCSFPPVRTNSAPSLAIPSAIKAPRDVSDTESAIQKFQNSV